MNKDIIYEIIKYLDFKNRYNFLITNKLSYNIWKVYKHPEMVKLKTEDTDQVIKIIYENTNIKFSVKCKKVNRSQLEQLRQAYEITVYDIDKNIFTKKFLKGYNLRQVNIVKSKRRPIGISQGIIDSYLRSNPRTTFFRYQASRLINFKSQFISTNR